MLSLPEPIEEGDLRLTIHRFDLSPGPLSDRVRYLTAVASVENLSTGERCEQRVFLGDVWEELTAAEVDAGIEAGWPRFEASVRRRLVRANSDTVTPQTLVRGLKPPV